ncbi:MFS transporter [Heliomarina baculiformis]|uniref:MFS transporter n=1 Tax=Heliomarina baculiformis TaxID=2872036 RepID=UPI002352F474|nr:MFS transporter [Heliomarina baculiformis]
MRWRILFVLAIARASMALQFASIGALGPLYEDAFQIDTTDLGLLVGIYFLPSVFGALPAAMWSNKFGERRVLLCGLALMVIGAIVVAASDSWLAQAVGRIVSGKGAVLLNVVSGKLVADWFSGREHATATAIFVHSWFAGIAAALLIMPPIAESIGLAGAGWVVVAIAVFALVSVAICDLKSDHRLLSSLVAQVLPGRPMILLILLAGMAWGMYNGALAIILSFGPADLVGRGRSLIEASAVTSILIWCAVGAGIMGGLIADLFHRPLTVLFVSTTTMLVAMVSFPLMDRVVLPLLFLGFAAGLPSSLFLALAASALQPQERSFGLGLFFTAHFLVFSSAPALAGKVVSLSTNSEASFLFGAALLFVAMLLAFLCLKIHRITAARNVPI